MMNLSQLRERVGLMSGTGTPLFISSILSSNNETSKQKEMSWPNQPDLRFPKMECREPSLYSSGWDRGGTNETMQDLIGRVKRPFTPLQWMELEHQALIYMYINAKASIPSSLLVSIRLADPSLARSLGSSRVGWGHFQLAGLPLSNGDPEPGRCRRTDGKKWRCTKNVVPEYKYCERHMVRSRHRSRKPVEKQNAPANHSDEPEGAGKVDTSFSRSSTALFGSPYPSTEKTTTKSLNLEKSSPIAFNMNQLVNTPLEMSTFESLSSNSTINFSGSSYLKNNSYMSSSTVNLSGSESPPHLLQDFIDLIGSPGSECSLQVGRATSAGGPLGEILGNSNNDSTNHVNNTCYPNAFITSLEWSLS